MRAVTLADTLPAVRWRPVWRGVAPKRLSREFPAGADLRGGGPLRPARLHRQSGKRHAGDRDSRRALRPAGVRKGPQPVREDAPGKRGVQALEGEDPWHRRRAERRRRAGGSTLEPARAARACASMGCQTRAGRTARLPPAPRPRRRRRTARPAGRLDAVIAGLLFMARMRRSLGPTSPTGPMAIRCGKTNQEGETKDVRFVEGRRRPPVIRTRRDPRREVGELARGGVYFSGPDRGAVQRGEGGGGAALRAGPRARERLRAVREARRRGRGCPNERGPGPGVLRAASQRAGERPRPSCCRS